MYTRNTNCTTYASDRLCYTIRIIYKWWNKTSVLLYFWSYIYLINKSLRILNATIIWCHCQHDCQNGDFRRCAAKVKTCFKCASRRLAFAVLSLEMRIIATELSELSVIMAINYKNKERCALCPTTFLGGGNAVQAKPQPFAQNMSFYMTHINLTSTF